MVVAVLVCAVVGFAAARSIVAEADAHRQELPDRWWDPVCTTCDSGLRLMLMRCRTADHPQRPANGWILAASTVLVGLMPLAVPSWWVLPAYVVFGAFGVLLAVTDLDTKLLPNRILVRAFAVGGPLLVIGGLIDADIGALGRAVLGGAAYFAIMLVLAIIARGALGFGDVKLAALLGVFTGYLGWGHVVIAGVGSFLVAGAVAILLLVTRRASRKDSIPFGPFMIAAAFIAVYLGDAIVEWYRS